MLVFGALGLVALDSASFEFYAHKLSPSDGGGRYMVYYENLYDPDDSVIADGKVFQTEYDDFTQKTPVPLFKVVFESDGVKFSTPICFEDVFGYLSAEFVASGADVIVNMSNDNWSKKVSAEMQHAAMGAMRSVETRKSTVRGTNSGISCLITPEGMIHEKMEPFAMGWHLYQVPVYTHESNPDTFYVRHIDLFAHAAVWAGWILLGAGAVMKIVSAVRRRSDES